METEKWETVEGYEGYKISNLGNVLGLKYNKIRKPAKDKLGYLRVDLWKDSKSKNKLVHRLVAIAFIPNPLILPYVNHLDGNKENNTKANLDWCTKSENTLHAFRVLGRTVLRGKDHGMYGKKNPKAYFLTKYKNETIT